MAKTEKKEKTTPKNTKYADMAKKAVDNNSAKALVHEHFTFEEEGEIFIGKLINITNHSSADFEKDCNKYLFDTDDGKRTAIFGKQVDSILNEKDYTGSVIMIKYEGKDQIGKGRIMNMYKVTLIELQINK